MAQRRVSSITWRQVASSEIELRHDNGEVELVAGTHADAAHLAQRYGLAVVPSPLGTIRWEPAAAPGGPAAAAPGAPPGAPGPGPAAGETASRAQEPPPDDRPRRRRTGTEAPGAAARPKRIGPWLTEAPGRGDE